jgi:glycosyltransferase involved in cell wall biosynthesis
VPVVSERAPRIGHVITTPGLGGVPVVVRALIDRLADRCDTTVYALGAGTGNEASRRAVLDQLRAAGSTVRLCDAPHRLGTVGQLASWFAEDALDLVHTHSYKPNLWGRLAVLAARAGGMSAPVVAHYHNTYDVSWERDGTLVLDRALLGGTEAVVACSTAVADHVADRLQVARSQITVVGNGVDLARFTTGRDRTWRATRAIAADVPLVGVVGRIGVQKAQDVVITALPKLLATHPSAHVVLIGAADHEDDERHLRTLVRDLDLAERVTFAGHCREVPEAMASLDVLAVPSRWEGFGLVAAEALATGTPLVVSDVTALTELTEGSTCARVVPVDDDDALANALADALSATDETRRRVEAGVRRAGGLGWAAAAETLWCVYARLLAGGSR